MESGCVFLIYTGSLLDSLHTEYCYFLIEVM